MKGQIILLVTLCSMAFVFGEEENVSNLDKRAGSPLSEKYEFLLRPKRGLLDFGLHGGYGLYGDYDGYDRYGDYDRYGGYNNGHGGYNNGYGGYNNGYGGYNNGHGGYNNGYKGYNDYYNSYPHNHNRYPGGYNNYANSNADSFSASAGFGPFNAVISTSHANANAGSSGYYGGRPYYR